MEGAYFMNLLLIPSKSVNPTMTDFLLSSKLLSLIQASVTLPIFRKKFREEACGYQTSTSMFVSQKDRHVYPTITKISCSLSKLTFLRKKPSLL